ncbi:hypothetical protein PENTCL1PPCAC_18862, partial [Pristionchus entomophagus]
VYYRIWMSNEYRTSSYLRLFRAKAINEFLFFLLNLFCLHLPIQSYLVPFFKTIAHSIIFPICGSLLVATVNATFLYGVF